MTQQPDSSPPLAGEAPPTDHATAPVSLSGVVTSFNSAASIEACLRSLRPLCPDLLVLDSGSTDGTVALAQGLGARVMHQDFAGYGAQKVAAIALAQHDWVLLLDSDEALDPALQSAILALTRQPARLAGTGGFRMRRRERIFWRYQHALSKHNQFLRLFDRRVSHMSRHAVHESIICQGAVETLPGLIIHDGDTSIRRKADKLNLYSSLAAQDRPVPHGLALALRITVYPVWYFLRAYLLRRQCLNGWAGYINSVELAHGVFLKYAKLTERKMLAAANKPR